MVNMEEYEGSPELDVDLELLAVYEKRLERAIRVKDKVRRLARHHKVFLSDVTKLNDNLERAKTEARHALEAKKRMLQQALDRRFEEAMEAVDDEIQGKKLPLEQAVQDMKRSSAVLEAALETLEDKLKEPQHDFIQRFVPMIEEIESHVAHAQNMRTEYDALVDDDLVLACVDDFCRLTVRHRVKKAGGGGGSPYLALRTGSHLANGAACNINIDSVDSYDDQVPVPRHHRPPEQFLSKKIAANEEPVKGRKGRYLSRKLAEQSSEGVSGKDALNPGNLKSPGNSLVLESQQTDHLKKLVREAYTELEDLYGWLRRSGISAYGPDEGRQCRPQESGPRRNEHTCQR